uniref:Titin n=1 Tax=Parascaris univalens TaxID=6257 RepID=A0A915ANX4_PARUN
VLARLDLLSSHQLNIINRKHHLNTKTASLLLYFCTRIKHNDNKLYVL